MSINKVITRFPPSPTGRFHVGSARTTLFNYLYALQNKGEFVLRFEDTDRQRSKKEYEDDIMESLKWLGIDKFEAPYRQSERSHVYRSYLEKLISGDLAYVSEEEPKEEGQRSSVIRFKNPNKEISFNDTVRGEITVDTTDLGDFVIAKSLDEPLYHLAVVIDDYEAGITHVIRGEDHISNTPRQILVQEAIGAPRPQYAHIPMILGHDKAKLSKRHGAKSVLEYRDEGYLPAAMINYLALLGWHPSGGNEQEVFSFDELIAQFNIEEVQKSGAVFSEEKLRWINKAHLQQLDNDTYFRQLDKWLPQEIKSLPQFSPDRLRRALSTLRERVEVYSDVVKMAEAGELEFFFETPGYFAKDLIWKKTDQATTKQHVEHLIKLLSESPNDTWDEAEKLKDLIWPYADREGRGDVLWPLRYALSGADRSPDPFTLLHVLGKEESLQRLNIALNKLYE